MEIRFGYFVTYVTAEGVYGNSSMTQKTLIRSYEDIEKIQGAILAALDDRGYNFHGLIVLSYKLMNIRIVRKKKS